MERINETLQKLAKNENFQQRYQSLKQEILQHPDIIDFVEKYENDLTSSILEKSLVKLYEYISQTKECRRCESLESCVNMMKGYQPELIFNGRTIELQYQRCPQKVVYDERKKTEKLIRSIYVPKDILEASFKEIDLEGVSRLKAVKMAKEFCDQFEPGKKMKGLYIWGRFGVGKSYLLGAIANRLAEKQIASVIVYVPEFFREMKQSLNDMSLNDKLDAIKKAPVLMLDDIGAESMSSWVRDDILGTILQYRMLDHLPTFFSSNFNFDDLEHHLTYSQRGEEERIKAARIMERIKYLAQPIQLEGPNRRFM
ncbi:MAG: primosomal protein DnaI [Bacillus sp. (in: Bacteria)]|nr:primosomal protein DnaI [Bacillus sp. (in: firmicutes)]